MSKFIHLNCILRFIKEKEGADFQIVDSALYDVSPIMTFKAIIPSIFNVSKVYITDISDDIIYDIKIEDIDGNNAFDGPNIILWNSELYTTKPFDLLESNKSRSSKLYYISSDNIDNGVLIFQGFNNIPEIVSFSDIEIYM